MKCKNCGAEIEEDRRFCPECGEPVELPEDDGGARPDTEPLDEPADSIAEDPGLESGAPEEAAPPAAPQASVPRKRGMTGLVAILLAVAVVLTLGAGLYFALRDQDAGETEPEAPSTDGSSAGEGTADPTFVDPAPKPTPDAVIATMAGHDLTNETFLFYYWDEFYYLYGQYGSYITSLLDPTKSFAAQEQSEGVTWRQYLADSALKTWAQTMTLCDAAEAAGFSISAEDQAELDGISAKLDGYAAQYSVENGEQYLKQSYDDAVTLAGFQSYLAGTYLASGYVNSAYDGFMTDHADLADQVKYKINIRHILIKPAEETDESRATAKSEAERVYALWQEDPTVDNFTALAAEYSADGTKDSGGLYEAVSPGDMVDTFNDWCFDETRKAGDSGIVETKYGYHIMYFDGLSDETYESAQETAARADYEAWLDPILKDAAAVRTDAEIGYSR